MSALEGWLWFTQGNVSDPNFSDAILTGGRVPLDGGETLDFDVFMPCFAAGPNTSFLVSSKSNFLDSRGALVTNDCLQSTAHPEVFGVGITTTKVPGHPVSSRITAQSKHCASEAVAVIEGKEPKTFKDKEAPTPLPHPMNVKIGHGPGGYMIWSGLPGPAKVCCCQCCNGGFPFCPPPCCWCCIPGCSGACGTCGKPSEGEGPAIFMPNLMHKMFTTNHGFKTLGDYGSEVPKQAKMTWRIVAGLIWEVKTLPICCREGNVFLPFVQESFLACMSRFRWLVKFDRLKLNSLKATSKTQQFQTNLFPFRLLLSFDKKHTPPGWSLKKLELFHPTKSRVGPKRWRLLSLVPQSRLRGNKKIVA